MNYSLKKTLLSIIAILAVLYTGVMFYLTQHFKDIISKNLDIDQKNIEVSAYPHKINFNIEKDEIKSIITLNFLSGKLFVSIPNVSKYMERIQTLFKILPEISYLEWSSSSQQKEINFEVKLASRIRLLYYIYNNKYSNFIDLFNLSEKFIFSLNMLSNQNEHEFFRRNYTAIINFAFPDKKTYETPEEILADLPKHLSADLKLTNNNKSYDKNNLPSLERITHIFSSDKYLTADDTFFSAKLSLPSNGVFSIDKENLKDSIITLYKNCKVNIDFSNRSFLNSVLLNLGINNDNDYSNINLDYEFKIPTDGKNLYYRRLYEKLGQMTFKEKQDYISQLYNSIYNHISGPVFSKQVDKLKTVMPLMIDKGFQYYKIEDIVSSLDNTYKLNILANTPYHNNIDKTKYKLNIFDMLFLEGDLKEFSLFDTKNPKKYQGELLIRKLDDVCHSIMFGTILLSCFLDDKNLDSDMLMANYDKLFLLLKKLIQDLSDKPNLVDDNANINEVKYSYDIDLDNNVESKISKSKTLLEAINIFSSNFDNILKK